MISIDTNILVYGALERDSEKGAWAEEMLGRLPRTTILAAQVLGEFLNVVRRRQPLLLDAAIDHASRLGAFFATAPTEQDDMLQAARLASRNALQFWDALIWVVSARAGAKLLLSEDMQDGFGVLGMRVVNPFNEANTDVIEALLDD